MDTLCTMSKLDTDSFWAKGLFPLPAPQRNIFDSQSGRWVAVEKSVTHTHTCMHAHKTVLPRLTQRPAASEGTLTSHDPTHTPKSTSVWGERSRKVKRGPLSARPRVLLSQVGNYLAWVGMELAFIKDQRQSPPPFLCPEDVLDLDRRGPLLSLTPAFLSQADQVDQDFRKTAIEVKNRAVDS